MDPLDTEDGLRKRLLNLGDGGAEDGSLAEAIQSFQQAEGLTTTGDPDQNTKAQLQQRYGR